MNEFSFVVGATIEVQQGFLLWDRKIREYLNTYYQGNRENAKNTIFYICISKAEELSRNLIQRQDDFRSVFDNASLLAASCIIETANIEIEGRFYPGIEIESFTNSPWNTILYSQPETRKGSATSLVEELVRESLENGLSGILKAFTIPSARQFYRDIGFIETNGSGEMVLTDYAASEFLQRQEELRRLYRDARN